MTINMNLGCGSFQYSMQNHSSRDWKDWVKLRSQAKMLGGLWKQTRKGEAEQTFWLAQESDTSLQLSGRKEKEWMENKLGRKNPFLAEKNIFASHGDDFN